MNILGKYRQFYEFRKFTTSGRGKKDQNCF